MQIKAIHNPSLLTLLHNNRFINNNRAHAMQRHTPYLMTYYLRSPTIRAISTITCMAFSIEGMGTYS